MWKWIWAALAVALCGCFQTKDELTLKADGSGSVRIETRLLVPPEVLGGFGLDRGGDHEETPSFYPPTSEDEAKRLFPAKDFTVTANQEATNGGSMLVITATFKDVNALLASPYARAHGLSLAITNGALSFQAMLGVEAPARLAETKEGEAMMFIGSVPGLEEVKKRKDEMRAEFRVTLPNAIASTSAGGTRDGKTVAWVADRAKQTNAVEFARQTGAALEATCPADGLKFSPRAQPRLSMLPFADAPVGVITSGTALDTNQVAMAAKFLPCALQITRTLDLSGEGSAGQNEAQLIGTVRLPRELAPQKWGEVKIDEVVDANGTSLKLPQNPDEFGGRIPGRHAGADDDEDKKEGEEKDAYVGQRVTLAFQPPDWKVKEIARIKGSVALQYYSGTQWVKISNAIPANWIREMKSERDFNFDGSGQSVNDPKLAELGLALRLNMGVSQGPLISLMFDTSGSTAKATDAQIYDAEGRPWPTLFMRQGFSGEDSLTVMVAGKPKPPLSLALIVSGAGATVSVPILLEKVSVGVK